MKIGLEPSSARRTAHRLLDALFDELERTCGAVGPSARIGKKASAAAKDPPGAGIAPETAPHGRPGRRPRGEVTVGCLHHNKTSRVVRLAISPTLAGRIGLGPTFPCSCSVALVKRNLLAVGPGEGARVKQTGNGTRVTIYLGARKGFTANREHRSEACAYHLDLENRLIIEGPDWLHPTRPRGRRAKPGEDGKGETEASAAPAGDKGSEYHCGECNAARELHELYECPLCTRLTCKPEIAPCWQAHVRQRHHTTIAGRPPAMSSSEARR